MSRTRLFLAAGGLLAVVLLTAAAWTFLGARRTPEGQPPLTHLGAGSFSSLRDAFNAASGETRLVAMLSPT